MSTGSDTGRDKSEDVLKYWKKNKTDVKLYVNGVGKTA